MAKGRHLKPDFFTDKNIVSVSPLARLLYQGLWCYAADCGHLDDEPVEFKIRILPADSCDIEDLLAELIKRGRIERRDGVIYLPKLADHARIDKRYETLCDACREPSDVNAARLGNHIRWHQKRAISAPDCEFCTSDNGSSHVVDTTGSDPALTVPHRNHVADGDGDGDGDGDVAIAEPASKSSASRKRPATRLPEDWAPSEKHLERRQDGIDVEREAEKFRLHAEANDRRQVNWNAAFSQWLLNARPAPGGTVHQLPRRDEQGREILPPLPSRSPWGP